MTVLPEYDYIRTAGPAFGRGKVEAGIYYSPRHDNYIVLEKQYRVGTYNTLEEARAVRDEMVRTRPKRIPKKAGVKEPMRFKNNREGLEHCLKCKYHQGTVTKGNGKSGTYVHCQYFDMTGISRVKLHYERTGRQSLAGMTHGKNCTEFEPMPPKKRGPKKKEASA